MIEQEYYRPTYFQSMFYSPIVESGYFDITEFRFSAETSLHNNTERLQVTIEYLPLTNHRATFLCTEHDKSGPRFTWITCPGFRLTKENGATDNDEELKMVIEQWLERIWQEISVSPLGRKLEEAHLQIIELVAMIEENEDDIPFTAGERADYNDRLDKLEDLLRTQIETTTLEQKDTETQLQQLQNDISILKTTIKSMTKKGWKISFITKTAKWASTEHGSNLLETIIDTAGKLCLPESPETAD